MIDLKCGDCLEVMKDIPDKSVDLVLTDPPYGTTACKWDSIIPLEPMWEQLKRIIKPNGAIIITASQPFTSLLVTSNLKMFKYEWIWEKDGDDAFFSIKWKYNNKVPNKKLRGTVGKSKHSITELGNGEWVAKTLEDAKQMATDFSKGVS